MEGMGRLVLRFSSTNRGAISDARTMRDSLKSDWSLRLRSLLILVRGNMNPTFSTGVNGFCTVYPPIKIKEGYRDISNNPLSFFAQFITAFTIPGIACSEHIRPSGISTVDAAIPFAVAAFLRGLGNHHKSLLVAVRAAFSFTMATDFPCIGLLFGIHTRHSSVLGKRVRMKKICHPSVPEQDPPEMCSREKRGIKARILY
jgi:hypothetical protein